MKKLLLIPLFFLPLTASAAIALDTSANAWGGTHSTVNISPTVDGAMDFVAAVNVSFGKTCTAATIGGTAMNQEAFDAGQSGQVGAIYIYNVATTTTTTATLTASFTCNSTNYNPAVADFTGVNQTTPVDSGANNLAPTTLSSPATIPMTTAVSNDVVVTYANASAFNFTTGGANTNGIQVGSLGFYYGGPFVTAGSNPLHATWTGGSQIIDAVTFALEPAAGAATPSFNFWQFFDW